MSGPSLVSHWRRQLYVREPDVGMHQAFSLNPCSLNSRAGPLTSPQSGDYSSTVFWKLRTPQRGRLTNSSEMTELMNIQSPVFGLHSHILDSVDAFQCPAPRRTAVGPDGSIWESSTLECVKFPPRILEAWTNGCVISKTTFPILSNWILN
jgi:hypothetical protein